MMRLQRRHVVRVWRIRFGVHGIRWVVSSEPTQVGQSDVTIRAHVITSTAVNAPLDIGGNNVYRRGSHGHSECLHNDGIGGSAPELADRYRRVIRVTIEFER